jgi:predicted transcriptional regulator
MSGQVEVDLFRRLTVQIVAAHVAHNKLDGNEVPHLIETVHKALTGLGKAAEEPAKPEPAVPVKKSVFPDYIVCLEDGKKLKMLKRHLKTAYGMTPDQYRAKWGLGREYPMVAPTYAKHRSSLARKIGLGHRAASAPSAPAAAAAPAPAPAKAPARRARKAAATK